MVNLFSCWLSDAATLIGHNLEMSVTLVLSVQDCSSLSCHWPQSCVYIITAGLKTRALRAVLTGCLGVSEAVSVVHLTKLMLPSPTHVSIQYSARSLQRSMSSSAEFVCISAPRGCDVVGDEGKKGSVSAACAGSAVLISRNTNSLQRAKINTVNTNALASCRVLRKKVMRCKLAIDIKKMIGPYWSSNHPKEYVCLW